MQKANVSVLKTSPETLYEDVVKLLDQCDFGHWDLKSPTYIKMNGNYDRKYPGSNTSPWFMDALLVGLKKRGFNTLLVIEGNLPYFTADQMIKRTGMIEILNNHNIPFINYESYDRDERAIPKILLNSQVINVPVPHGHGYAIMSCAVKNLFGILPNPRRRFHRTLAGTILMLADAVRPWTIVDATVGLIGPSTRRGTPARMDLIIGGWDPVAIDVIVARIMGYKIEDIPHLKLACDRGCIPEISLDGDYTWDSLPTFAWPLNIDISRGIAAWLESTWVEDLRCFQFVENCLERFYHNVTFIRKRKKLFRGPWMQYESQMQGKVNGRQK